MPRVHDIPNRVVLITGSRHWDEGPHGPITTTLDNETREGSFVLLHGDYETGADFIARMWWTHVGSLEGIQHLPMPADWRNGPTGGPTRNSYMVSVLRALRASMYSCRVHGFPRGESPGTRGCMDMARKAGFDVIDHSYGSIG